MAPAKLFGPYFRLSPYIFNEKVGCKVTGTIFFAPPLQSSLDPAKEVIPQCYFGGFRQRAVGAPGMGAPYRCHGKGLPSQLHHQLGQQAAPQARPAVQRRQPSRPVKGPCVQAQHRQASPRPGAVRVAPRPGRYPLHRPMPQAGRPHSPTKPMSHPCGRPIPKPQNSPLACDWHRRAIDFRVG